MQDLIPEDFVLQSEYATENVTIEDCLSHRSGMPTHQGCLGNHSVKESTRNMRHLSINKNPRTTWQYSNHMYWAVSHMIEVVSGKDLETFMTERLWKPLGMDATFLSLHQARRYVDGNKENCLAKPYGWNAETQSFSVLPYWDDEGISGSGALVSNVSDQAKWIRSFINQSGPLSKDAYAAVKTPHMKRSSTSPRFTAPDSYGLGWHISRYHGEEILHHPGGVVGFTANMIYLPERKWGVVGMCNSSTDSALEATMWHLVDEFLGISHENRIDVFAE
jgi:CubicO group peptidase (beta-lactamase class C family)